MIRPILNTEYELKLKPMMKKVQRIFYADKWNCELLFSEILPVRRVIFLPDPWLHEKILIALEKTILENKSKDFYIDIGKIEYSVSSKYQACLVSSYFHISSSQEFRYVVSGNGIKQEFKIDSDSDNFLIEGYRIYSGNLDWAIYVNEGYLLIGGTYQFMQLFDNNFLPDDYMDQLKDFLLYWRQELQDQLSLDIRDPYNWILRLMIHCLGEEQAINILKEFNYLSS
jgi:hypothetical protein